MFYNGTEQRIPRDKPYFAGMKADYFPEGGEEQGGLMLPAQLCMCCVVLCCVVL